MLNMLIGFFGKKPQPRSLTKWEALENNRARAENTKFKNYLDGLAQK